ncbi:MAG: hypothetical protein A2760_04170 [Candidatus Doudnabacteria bacterium RIFCSPHIGHO2_01_FULL_50_67]|uniref:NadR/Ttd14 AAA domain-containing protein n=1 Tax=Candidatus Doudnabacteria bacterium RIFCSPHIGHO2_12_FULL_48_16 TaxID=1817838 RepID=A0A1F5PKC2_9BACT|nr:MAG: hypothetical protein A3B77_03235 [Candidatus Doudnabacteria bacterium RIFCSPHIGHO2_02_FULL_49_24]OGE89130.1 MAG: hypothetical protein A2760_04170 [Candidatus Doudnabacteria bacterium RIFCSPHIGHO2_01_FULL_50_67]OGE90140.1 MAG: hypothetical protein A3E29_03470 [Candidatus Doudnabacteria bacterium RIFCSPHIGHO2_12_FULL_48_16]OGE97237.1 MAG: hypothetical protein A2990_01435 [Candidatus Doudnabacteria bacterium RIFCSPLOWO2_01_FULL_49_40]OGF03829.1 MAG: hypothetical protein A3H14_04170 [Candid
MTNNWYVITGGPSSGKTTVLELIEHRGFRVEHEAARIFIEQELKRGLTLRQIRADEAAFQRHILQLKNQLEQSLAAAEQIFFDRGIPDSLAYYKFLNIRPTPAEQQLIESCRYKKVFLLEPVAFAADHARTETAEEAAQIHGLLGQVYADLGLNVIAVPLSTPSKRRDFILNNL